MSGQSAVSNYKKTTTTTVSGVTALGNEGGSGVTAGVGGGLAPIVSFNFLSGTLNPSITLTRASIGTYYNSSGLLSTAASGAPRFDYNPVTKAASGLLIEEGRTNNLIYSNDVTQSPWSGAGLNNTPPSNTTSPDGTVNGIKLTALAGNTQHNEQQQITAAIGTYTASTYLKYSNNQWAAVAVYDPGASAWKVGLFDLLNGVTGTSHSGTTISMISVGNGWYRCAVTYTITGANPYIGIFIQNTNSVTLTWTAVGTEAIFMYGAQLELGAFATSYIPTTTAAVVRSPDLYSFSTVPAWYNTPTGTWVVQFDVENVPTGVVANAIVAGTTGSPNLFGYTSGVFGGINGTFSTGTGVILSTSVTAKGGISYAAGNYLIGGNGGTASSTNAAVPAAPTSIGIGNASGTALNGHMQVLQYYNTALTASQLQSVTTLASALLMEAGTYILAEDGATHLLLG
jgi:hypothetical protein